MFILDIWGPFLVISPNATLYNWQQEVNKFCPNLKVLPYWGGLKERKFLKKFFNPLNLYTKQSAFHVCITSYQFMVQDQKLFNKVSWQYMILDEAHSIKNINSRRWNTLLQFSCRNRLLLTGTPIQNSMSELWALLHFIMPNLFDSHEQFQEWFSKDIEAHSQSKGELNEEQLKRLHTILKPFMLRRIKKDVENEIGHKTEYEIKCDMTKRQQVLYQSIKSKLSNLSDLFTNVDSKVKYDNLMNLVMQFRKVCNHPELFERHIGKIPFAFKNMFNNAPISTIPIANTSVVGVEDTKYIYSEEKNVLSYCLSKLIYDELFFYTIKNENNSIKYNKNWNPFILVNNVDTDLTNVFPSLSLSPFNNSELKKLCKMNDITSFICLIHYFKTFNIKKEYLRSYIRENEEESDCIVKGRKNILSIFISREITGKDNRLKSLFDAKNQLQISSFSLCKDNEELSREMTELIEIRVSRVFYLF